ncbi:MAG: ABC transporter permease [Terracidiphilus sp.]|jgi:predicted permease
MFSDLLFRLRALILRKRMETELDQELRFHFEHEVEKHLRAGMTSAEATRRARLSFGGHEQIKEDCREARGTSLLETSLQDIRFSLRTYRKTPGFFLIAALTLALGIGASTAVFSLVNLILLKPLPYPNASRIVMPWRHGPIGSVYGSDDFPWGPAEFSLIRQTQQVFQQLAAFKKDDFNLTGSANSETLNPELLEGVRASQDFFPALGVSPVLGRTFAPEDDQLGHEHVVVLSYALWKSRFAAESGVLGRVIHLNGFPYTVIGVMPAGFTFPTPEGMPASIDIPKQTQLWVPLALPITSVRGASDLEIIGELKSGVSLAQALDDLHAFDQRLIEKYPNVKGWFSSVVPLEEQIVMDTRQPLLLLLGAVCVVLLIACSNVAGLMLNRSVGRRKEFTLRGALGAQCGRLVRQLMTESMMLALTGGVFGVAFAQASLNMVKLFGPTSLPQLQKAGLDLRVLAFSLGITLIAGLLFGLAPAFGATRMNMVETLKEGGQRSGSGVSAPRIRNALLVSQVALALVLVTSAGLLVRTFYQMLRSNSGFNAMHVVTFELPLPSSKYSDTDRMAQLYSQVLVRLKSISGVESAGCASIVAMAGPTDNTVIRVPGHVAQPGSPIPFADYLFVSPSYFASIGAPIERGRDIADSDTLPSMPVAIVNNAMARKFWPGENPIGKQVGVGSTKYPLRIIIGVVPDIKQVSLREVPGPTMFVPYTQNEIKIWPSMQSMQFAIRTQVDPASIAGSVRLAIHEVDSDLPIANFETLTTIVNTSMSADRFTMFLLAIFGLLALTLAAIGMYGVISYSVMQRTPEIGIRIALGASRRRIFAMVLGQGGRLVSIGIAIGLIAAFGVTRLMTSFLYQVRPTDPVTFASVSLLLIAVALLACYVPARKAMKVDPMIALRYE